MTCVALLCGMRDIAQGGKYGLGLGPKETVGMVFGVIDLNLRLISSLVCNTKFIIASICAAKDSADWE